MLFIFLRENEGGGEREREKQAPWDPGNPGIMT